MRARVCVCVCARACVCVITCNNQYFVMCTQDFDIAGDYDLMIPDAECLRVISEILTDLDMKKFVIKVSNHS